MNARRLFVNGHALGKSRDCSMATGAHRTVASVGAVTKTDLFFLSASIGKAQAHDGAHSDHRVLLVHKVVQQRIRRVVLMLQSTIEDADSQQRSCRCISHVNSHMTHLIHITFWPTVLHARKPRIL